MTILKLKALKSFLFIFFLSFFISFSIYAGPNEDAIRQICNAEFADLAIEDIHITKTAGNEYHVYVDGKNGQKSLIFTKKLSGSFSFIPDPMVQGIAKSVMQRIEREGLSLDPDVMKKDLFPRISYIDLQPQVLLESSLRSRIARALGIHAQEVKINFVTLDSQEIIATIETQGKEAVFHIVEAQNNDFFIVPAVENTVRPVFDILKAYDGSQNLEAAREILPFTHIPKSISRASEAEVFEQFKDPLSETPLSEVLNVQEGREGRSFIKATVPFPGTVFDHITNIVSIENQKELHQSDPLHARIKTVCEVVFPEHDISSIHIKIVKESIYAVTIDAGDVTITTQIIETKSTGVLTLENPQVRIDATGETFDHSRTHELQFEKIVPVFLDKSSIAIPLSEREVRKLADNEDFHRIYDFSLSRDQTFHLKANTPLIAAEISEVLFKQLKLRLGALGFTVDEKATKEELTQRLYKYGFDTQENKTIQKLFTNLIHLDAKLKILEKAIDTLENFYDPERGLVFEKTVLAGHRILTKKGAEKLTQIRIEVHGIFESMALDNLSTIFNIHGDWNLSKQKIKLRNWMFYDLITQRAERLLQLLERTKNCDVVSFYFLNITSEGDLKISHEFSMGLQGLGALDWKETQTRTSFKFFVESFTQAGWLKPRVRPALRWLWEASNRGNITDDHIHDALQKGIEVTRDTTDAVREKVRRSMDLLSDKPVLRHFIPKKPSIQEAKDLREARARYFEARRTRAQRGRRGFEPGRR